MKKYQPRQSNLPKFVNYLGNPRLWIYVMLVLCSCVFMIPIAWMISTSLMPLNDTLLLPPKWIPSQIQWENYPHAIESLQNFGRLTFNSLFICGMSVIGTVISSALTAYGFSRIEWRGRDTLFWAVPASMMIPFYVIMVPLFSLFKDLNMLGTSLPLWFPTFFASSFSVFLLRQFFRTLPKELNEAARLEGCSEFRIFWQIILPLSKPALLIVAIFQFMWSWNDFLGPMIYLTDAKDYTLALGLEAFQSQHGGTPWNLLMAASTLVSIPVIILFFLSQRYFIEGIATTGRKE